METLEGTLRRLEGFQLFASLFSILLVVQTSEVGGYNTDPYNDISNANRDSSLCRVVRDTRKQVLTSFRNQYTASASFCDISNHCANVNCTAEFSRGRVNAGLVLNLCEEDPELMYWVDIPGQWDQPWNYTFSSSKSNGEVERQEIIGSSKEAKPTRWFIKNTFSISHGRNQANHGMKYMSLQTVLQICEGAATGSSEGSCTNTTLFKFPRLPETQICETPVPELSGVSRDDDDDDLPHPLMKFVNDKSSYLSSTRSSRNANADPNAWNPEDLHKQAQEKAKKFENGVPLKTVPGDKCDIHGIFDCGAGFGCLRMPDGSGTCICLPGFSYDAKSGTCLKRAPSPSADADSLDSRSYSSAVGVVISLLFLVGIAAGIYFGIKYNYFTRIRHRLPVLRCWPFRRSQPWEDNVTMVNPLGPPDDDDPPLL